MQQDHGNRSNGRSSSLMPVLLANVLVFAMIIYAYTSYKSNSIQSSLQTSTSSSSSLLASGLDYKIYIPAKDPAIIKELSQSAKPLFASPEVFVSDLIDRYHYLDKIVINDEKSDAITRARHTYISLIKSFVSGKAYGRSERSVELALAANKKKYKASNVNVTRRNGGEDQPYLGETMIGEKRLDNLHELLVNVLEANIAGDVMETGVWRGGTVILARAILRAFQQPQRRVYACDSFRGLPPGNSSLHVGDAHWNELSYFEVDAATVAKNFHRYQLLDEQVCFCEGYFKATMPRLVKIVQKLALLRLDGDMYESTAVVLYHMYDKVLLNGVIILDDWGLPAQQACQDFFVAHNIAPIVKKIDNWGVYWRKTEEVIIQYWRYQQQRFKPNETKQS